MFVLWKCDDKVKKEIMSNNKKKRDIKSEVAFKDLFLTNLDFFVHIEYNNNVNEIYINLCYTD